MPATSKAQRRFFGMLLHHPGLAKLRGVDMSEESMRDYASTKEKGLPEKVESYPVIKRVR